MFSFRGFAAGFVVALASLALAGSVLPERVVFADFARLNIWTSAGSQYFPTARQLATLVRHEIGDSERIAVIVGGSSVFRGAGQVTNELWTKKLQQQLGPRYAVINLAADAGTIAGYGLWTTEMLVKAGHEVVFVSNLSEADQFPDGIERYRYFFYDGVYSGLLLRWPERMSFIAERSPPEKTQTSRDELKIRAFLNSIFRFDDLWNAIGYCCLNTVWTVHTSSRPFEGRIHMPDNEVHPPTPYPHPFEGDMRGVRASASRPAPVDSVRASLTTAIAPSVANHTILVQVAGSPRYERRLEPELRQKLKDKRAEMVREISQLGLQTLQIGEDFEDGDFVDSSHLSAAGGEKLARALAPAVMAAAQRLGYLAKE